MTDLWDCPEPDLEPPPEPCYRCGYHPCICEDHTYDTQEERDDDR